MPETDIEQTQQVIINPDLFNEFVRWIDRSEATTSTYIKALRQFYGYIQANDITQPTRDDVIAYRQMLMEQHKANTVALYIRAVRLFFAWTADMGIYPNIADHVRVPKVDRFSHKKDAFSPSDIQAIEESILSDDGYTEEQRTRLYAMFELALNTGMRTTELSRANVGDIETRSGQSYIFIWGKGRDEPDQKKPIAPQVMQAINDYLAFRTDNPSKKSPLFVSTGNRSGGKRIASTTISTMLKRAMKRAGFNSERLTAHSIRHTTGTSVQMITGDLLQTQHYMRHTDPATTEIYVHVQQTEQETKTADELYDYLHQK